MNLKEAFRYQKFLDRMMGCTGTAITDKDNSHKVTKTHLRSKAAEGADDVEEIVENEKFISIDSAIALMRWIINERDVLTHAINRAKAGSEFDIDAAVESNKFRQRGCIELRHLLTYKPAKYIVQGKDYKFNAEGNQMPYFYDIEVISEEAYDRAAANSCLKELRRKADEVSAAIDSAMVNTVVDYEPRFDVNTDFDEMIAEFS